MARFFLAGGLVGLSLNDSPLEAPPAGATILVDSAAVAVFDPATNATLVNEFSTQYARFSASGGVLRRDGVSVTYAADSPLTVQSRIVYAGGVRLAADRTRNAITFADVQGLSFQVEAGKHYSFEFDGSYSTAVNTTALWLAMNGPTFTVFGANFWLFTSVTALLARSVGAYDVGPEPTASAGTTVLPWRIVGTISPSASGLLTVRFRSEVNGSDVTIRSRAIGKLFQGNG